MLEIVTFHKDFSGCVRMIPSQKSNITPHPEKAPYQEMINRFLLIFISFLCSPVFILLRSIAINGKSAWVALIKRTNIN